MPREIDGTMTGDSIPARRSTPTHDQPSDSPAVFGLAFDDLDIDQCARRMLTDRRTPAQGVGLFVTPNIQHIALARTDPDFAAAMREAQIVVADGFPVYRFARYRGVALPGRVTGREVVERMFADPAALAGHRGYFLLDSDDTARLIRDWLGQIAPDFVCETYVPPFGFDRDPARCAAIVDSIAAFAPTLFFLCVGAPKSELFVHHHRATLPPCWALCVGQSFRLLLGTTRPPPAALVSLNLEWLWRIILEPRRMIARYGPSGVGFLRAAIADLRRDR